MRTLGTTIYPDRIIHEYCDLEQCDRAAKHPCNNTCPHKHDVKETRKVKRLIE